MANKFFLVEMPNGKQRKFKTKGKAIKFAKKLKKKFGLKRVKVTPVERTVFGTKERALSEFEKIKSPTEAVFLKENGKTIKKRKSITSQMNELL